MRSGPGGVGKRRQALRAASGALRRIQRIDRQRLAMVCCLPARRLLGFLIPQRLNSFSGMPAVVPSSPCILPSLSIALPEQWERAQAAGPLRTTLMIFGVAVHKAVL
jgi:hypothetical protein